MGTSSPDSDASSSQQQYAKAGDWEQHRDTITKLYRDQDLHLDEVISIMARDHQFFANQRMYKTRIKKWGIDKNQKAKEVGYMLKVKQQRAALGKDTEFVVRGRKVDWGKIEQYLKRDPALLRKTAGDTLEIGNAAGIICKTPPPDPAVALSIPPPPIGSMENRLPEEIALLARDYFKGCFEKGVWIDLPDGTVAGRQGAMATDRLRKWGQTMRLGRHCIAIGKNTEGFQLLGRCMDQMTQLVVDEDPTLLYHFLGNTIGLTPQSRELGAAVCKHIRELCHIKLGAQHPLSRIFDRFNAMAKSETHYLSLSIPVQALVDLFATRDKDRGAKRDPRIAVLYRRYANLLRGNSGGMEDPAMNAISLNDIVDFYEESNDPSASMCFQFEYLAYLTKCLVKARGGEDSSRNGSTPAGGSSSTTTGNATPSAGTSTTTDGTSPPNNAEAGPVVRFRESRYYYIFDSSVLAAQTPEPGTPALEPTRVLWEPEVNPDDEILPPPCL